MPVRCGVEVTAVAPAPAGRGFVLATSAGPVAARQVVIATGAYRTPRLPAMHASLPPTLHQLHSRDYRRPVQLPPGATLVVGSGESGCQIADELRRDGRLVILAVGRSAWLPRRYRGRDSIAWLAALGAFDQEVATLPGGHARTAPPGPQLTGRDGGCDLNLHTLAREGVVLMGHLREANGQSLTFAPDLRQQIAAVDDHVRARGLDAPPGQLPRYTDAYASIGSRDDALDLGAVGITSLIWATGFRPDFGWIALPLCDAKGYPIHRRGITAIQWLYFLGLE